MVTYSLSVFLHAWRRQALCLCSAQLVFHVSADRQSAGDMLSIVSISTTSGLFSLSLSLSFFFFFFLQIFHAKCGLGRNFIKADLTLEGFLFSPLLQSILEFSTSLQVAFLISAEVLCSCVLIFIMWCWFMYRQLRITSHAPYLPLRYT